MVSSNNGINSDEHLSVPINALLKFALEDSDGMIGEMARSDEWH
jgi:hypothetical protein